MFIEIVTSQYFIFALIAGCLLAGISSILGSLVLWRKVAYYGDALAHCLPFGVALSILFNYDITLAVSIFAICFAIIYFYLSSRKVAELNSLLGLLASFFLALAIILINANSRLQFNFEAIFFGDILSINKSDLISLLVILAIVIVWFVVCYRQIIMFVLNQDLAQIINRNSKLYEFSFYALLSLFIAFASKLFGVLLVSAALINPGLFVRLFSKSPKQMVIYSFVYSILAYSCGMILAAKYDIAPGALIVAITSSIYLASQAGSVIIKRLRVC